jgi:Tol biopolymer transport system component
MQTPEPFVKSVKWWMPVLAAFTLVGCDQKKGVSRPEGTPTIRQSIEKPQRQASLGVRKLEGRATELRASPDGRVVTVMMDAEKPRLDGVPPTMRLGSLWVVPTGAGSPVKVANGAVNVPGGLLFTSDGKFALILGAYDPSQQSGELLVQDLTDLSKERQRLAPHVTYMKPSADGTRLAYVDDGVLFEGVLPSGPFRQLAGEVATAEFAPNGRQLYFRRKSVAGGGLYQLELSEEKPTPKRFVDAVGEYVISNDSKWVIAMARTNPRQVGFELFVGDSKTLKPVKLGDDVMRFAISRDSQWVARMQVPANVSASPTANDLQIGELWFGRLGQSESRKVGQKVREFEFTQDSKKLIFRDNYQVLALMGGTYDEKVGDLTTVTLPDGPPKVIQKRSPNYELSPDGAAIAFTARIDAPEYSRHLFLLKEGEAPVKLQEWLYDYSFSPKGDRLYYRANCTREGRSCDLLSQDLAKVGVEKAKKVQGATFNFKLSADGSHVLTSTPHMRDELFDLALTNLLTGETKVLDQYVSQPIQFLSNDGTMVAWVVLEKGTAGVYVGTGLP